MDQLTSIDHPISEHEHLEVILEGLPADYNAFVASILSRIDPYRISELEALLMALESRLEKQVGSTSLDLLQQANLANKSSGSTDTDTGSVQNGVSQPQAFQANRGGGRGGRGRGRSGGRFRGRGGRSYGRASITCQICLKPGH